MPPKSGPKTRKRAASNVAGTMTTKKARKTKQPTHPEDPELVEEDQGEEGEAVEKEKPERRIQGGRGRGGKVVVKGRGPGGQYIPLYQSLIS